MGLGEFSLRMNLTSARTRATNRSANVFMGEVFSGAWVDLKNHGAQTEGPGERLLFPDATHCATDALEMVRIKHGFNKRSFDSLGNTWL